MEGRASERLAQRDGRLSIGQLTLLDALFLSLRVSLVRFNFPRKKEKRGRTCNQPNRQIFSSCSKHGESKIYRWCTNRNKPTTHKHTHPFILRQRPLMWIRKMTLGFSNGKYVKLLLLLLLLLQLQRTSNTQARSSMPREKHRQTWHGHPSSSPTG